MQTKKVNTHKLVTVALFAAISTVLMFIEVPLPLMPPFLKLDISAVPIMVGSFALGPIEGLTMAFIKACVHLLSTQTAGVGEIADFLITGSFALTAGIVYRRHKSKKGARIATIASIFVVTVVASLANYFLLLPFYAKAYNMPLEAVIGMCQAVNPAIDNLFTYIMLGIVPFNLIKGSVVAILTFVVYKRLSHFIHQYTGYEENVKPSPKKVAEKV